MNSNDIYSHNKINININPIPRPSPSLPRQKPTINGLQDKQDELENTYNKVMNSQDKNSKNILKARNAIVFKMFSLTADVVERVFKFWIVRVFLKSSSHNQSHVVILILSYW